MCGLIGQRADDLKNNDWAKRKIADTIKNDYSIVPKKQALIVRVDMPDQLEMCTFSYTIPVFNKRQQKTINQWKFNLRVEGWRNKANDVDYSGPLEIWTNPACERIIRYNRCIIPVSYFVENPENDKKHKFVIMRQDEQMFYLGGVFHHSVTASGVRYTGFAIITTPSTQITRLIGHQRAPLILQPDQFDTWFKQYDPEVIGELMRPAHTHDFKAWEVNPDIAKLATDGVDNPGLIEPIGEVITP